MMNPDLSKNLKKQINFLANPYSPHVRHWEELLNIGDYDLVIYTAHPLTSRTLVNSKVIEIIPPIFARLPMLLRYVVAGLLIRFCAKSYSFKFFHAHNTSGYGLTALLSGKQYLVTTYGSEIFKSHTRGCLYRLLIRAVLRRAVTITSTSSKMTECLISGYGIGKHKIHEFSLGVSKVFFFDQEGRDRIRNLLELDSSPVWVVNRRIHPLYHTVELIKAFVDFREATGSGFLLVLEGDSDPNYLTKVEHLCAGCRYIKLIHGFIPQTELRAYLSAADFSISVPESDQMSSSILEGAVCGAVPLLANLESYAPLRNASIIFTITDKNDSSSYDKIFYRSFEIMNKGTYNGFSTNMFSLLEKFRMASALSSSIHLYEGSL